MLGRVLRPGGTITVIEGDHGSAYFHPASAAAADAIGCLVELQARAGGDSLIGRRVYPLLAAAGFADVVVDPRVVYVDGAPPGPDRGLHAPHVHRDGGGRARAGDRRGPDRRAERFDAGIAALERTAARDGTFNYTFFKGVGVRSR